MPLGKNFRLPLDVRPVRYDAHLALDLPAGSFEGRMQLELRLLSPRTEIVLHALELHLSRARARLPEGAVPVVKITPDAESETVTLSFAEPLQAGQVILDLAWTGSFSPGLRGLYRAGATAVTQFESADARRVFPCFDEPGFKATWKLTLLQVPKGAAAISNGAIARDEPLSGAASGERQVEFGETKLLSSYLIAFCVGELVPSERVTARNVPIRTWSVPQKKHLTGFAQECAAAVLPLLEDYFGQPYAYGKLDQLGVPDFEAGAMENAGCITFREVALLLDAKTAPLSIQKRVAEVVTHELSHQWFGNLVTMLWWDDLWLNEAFATWMAYKIVDAWRPSFRVWMDFEVGKGAALRLDALQSSHPIHSEIKNAQEASESFDAITYEKGGAILRMLEGWLGEDAFREGIRLYMRRHREGNAVAADLWGALAETSGQPILALANGWIRQVGYPLVSMHEKNGQVTLTQERFFGDPLTREEGDSARWLVPVVLRFADRLGVHEKRLVLEGREHTFPIESVGAVAWLTANAGASGFYRVAYEDVWLLRLSENLSALSPVERMALVSDQWALVRAGKGELLAFLSLLAALKNEQDHTVLDEALGKLAWLEQRALGEQDRPFFQLEAARLFAPAAEDLGWDPQPQETDDRKLLRASALRALTLLARDPAAIAEAQARFTSLVRGNVHAVDPNLLEVVVTASARAADGARFAQLLELVDKEVDPASRRRLLLALASVEAHELVLRAVELALTKTVQMQDFSSYLGTLLANRFTREAAFALLRDRWDEVRRKSDSPMILRRLIESLGSLPERKHLEQVEAFLAAHPLDGVKQAIAQTLERMRTDVALRERLLPEVSAWARRGL